MVRFGVCLAGLLVAGCASDQTPPPAIQIKTVDVVKEVMRPCPVAEPKRPAKLVSPLPDDAVALSALLGQKLDEYSAPGKWADAVQVALRKCTHE